MRLIYNRINKEIDLICNEFKAFPNVVGIYTLQTSDNTVLTINIVTKESYSVPMSLLINSCHDEYRLTSLGLFGTDFKIRLISNRKFDDIGLGFINNEIEGLIMGDICYDPINELERIRDSGMTLQKRIKKD